MRKAYCEGTTSNNFLLKNLMVIKLLIILNNISSSPSTSSAYATISNYGVGFLILSLSISAHVFVLVAFWAMLFPRASLWLGFISGLEVLLVFWCLLRTTSWLSRTIWYQFFLLCVLPIAISGILYYGLRLILASFHRSFCFLCCSFSSEYPSFTTICGSNI